MENNPQFTLDLWQLIQQGAISTYPLLALLGHRPGRGARARVEPARHPALDGAISPARSCRCWRTATGRARSTSCGSTEPARRAACTATWSRTTRRCRSPSWSASPPSAATKRCRAPGRICGSSAPSVRRRRSSDSSARCSASSAPSTPSALAGTGGFPVVAAGISEALIATALGLAVGIVAVVAYNYFQSRVERIDGGAAHRQRARARGRRRGAEGPWRLATAAAASAASWPRSTSRRSPTSSWSC